MKYILIDSKDQELKTLEMESLNENHWFRSSLRLYKEDWALKRRKYVT